MADAIVRRDQEALFAALEGARAACTPAGYRILVQGFTGHMLHWLPDDTPGLVPRVDPTPLLEVDVAGDVGMTIGPDASRRAGWFSVRLAGPGSDGRYAPVHRDRLLGFVAALQEVSEGRAEAASLASLGRAWELVVARHRVSGHVAPAGGSSDPAVPFSLPTPRTTPGRLYAALRPHRSNW